MLTRFYNQIMTAFCHDLDGMVVASRPGIHPMPDPACDQVKKWLEALSAGSMALRALDSQAKEPSRAVDLRLNTVCAKYAVFNQPDSIPRLKFCLKGLKETAKDKLGRSLRKRHHYLLDHQQAEAIKTSLIEATEAFLGDPAVQGLFPSLRRTLSLYRDDRTRPAA